MSARVQFSDHELTATTAVILCGGRGERLRPLTDSIPKPLIPVNGRPLLDYLLEHLSRAGIREYILCVGYKAELFDAFVVQRGTRGTERIRCLNSGDAGITERLAAAAPLIGGSALVCYADTLADVDVRQLFEVHQRQRAEATITVHPYRSPFGVVTFDEAGFVSTFLEKPRLPYWINIGFLLFEPAALRRLRAEVSLPDVLTELADLRQLSVYCHHGRHWTANTETELRELAAELRTHWHTKNTNEIATS